VREQILIKQEKKQKRRSGMVKGTAGANETGNEYEQGKMQQEQTNN
jgi:hypothetical protein